jgi:hypothetical protein
VLNIQIAGFSLNEPLPSKVDFFTVAKNELTGFNFDGTYAFVLAKDQNELQSSSTLFQIDVTTNPYTIVDTVQYDETIGI